MTDQVLDPCAKPIECFDNNGDPCACNASGTGCQEENPNINVNIDLSEFVDPCQNLKLNFVNNVAVKLRVKQLLVNRATGGNEQAFSVSRDDGNGVPMPTATITSPSDDEVDIEVGDNIFAAAHNHPTNSANLIPMFSAGDLLTLAQISGNYIGVGQASPSNYTFVLATGGKVFALKYPNVNSMIFLESLLGDPIRRAQVVADIRNEIQNTTSNSPEDLFATLDTVCSAYMAPLDLYEANLNSINEVQSWNKFNKVTKMFVPCE